MYVEFVSILGKLVADDPAGGFVQIVVSPFPRSLADRALAGSIGVS